MAQLASDELDILVVGAGPVGLTLASELTRYGVSCRIVDNLLAYLGSIFTE